MMQSTLQDIRYSVRQIHRAPLFTAAVILTIALTISFTAVVFGVLYAVLINPLPYRQPDRIVALQARTAHGHARPASYPDYLDWRQMNVSLSALAAYNPVGSINFEGPQGPMALHLVSTTDNFFSVFGVHPRLGHTFAPGEDRSGRNDLVVLSYEVWQHQFGGRPSVIGETVKLDGRSFAVVGVMPAGFRFPLSNTDAVYIPLHLTRQQQARGNYWLMTVARLKNGIGLQQAQADMTRVLDDLGNTYSNSQRTQITLVDLRTFVVGDIRNPMRLLFYAVLTLLAIGCVNVASLLLIRGVKRDRELALRSALGASKWHIARQVFIEALIYSAVGTGIGILLAYALLVVTRALLATALARGSEVALNAEVISASVLSALVITLLASLAPLWRVSGSALNVRLHAGGNAGTSCGQHRWRGAFVVTQFALGLVLLVVSGLLLMTLARLRNADLGFSTDHILTAEIGLSPGRYTGRDVVADFYDPLLDKVKAIPSVQTAGLIQMLPIRSWGWNSAVHIIGTPTPAPNMEQPAEYRIVSAGYYSTFHDQLVRGRLIDSRLDTPTSQPVVVVNEAFARKFIAAGENPIGKQLDDDQKTTIIGVVRNIRQNIYQPPLAEIDYCISQIPPRETLRVVSRMQLVLRTNGDPKRVVPQLRRVFHDIDPTLPFRAPETMTEVVSETLILERLENWLFGSFAAVAVLLAMMGVYGLIGHEVELSRRDIGVRMALGSTRQSILWGIYRRVASMITFGLGIGLILTMVVKRYFESVVAIHLNQDAGYIVGIVFLLAFLGLSAALFPALHAATTEPSAALRAE